MSAAEISHTPSAALSQQWNGTRQQNSSSDNKVNRGASNGQQHRTGLTTIRELKRNPFAEALVRSHSGVTSIGYPFGGS